MVSLLWRYGYASYEYHSSTCLILPVERRDPEVLRQTKNLLTKSVVPIDELLSKNKFLVGEKILVLIYVIHSLYMANQLGCIKMIWLI